MDKWFEQDALYYADVIKQREVTVSELVEKALSAIDEVNPILNAVTIVQSDQARQQAKEMDQCIASLSGDERMQLPMFYGVPTLLKDLGQMQEGIQCTNGAKLMKDYVAQHTDYFVQQVLSLGFVVVGRTNTPEFGFKNISDSVIHGPVLSPFDQERHAGGSSGGAAASVASMIVPIAFASDGGGSIRIPASFNGLIGLKPSRGRMPVGPGSYRGWQGASTHFAMTKSIRDTWELLKGMQKEMLAYPFHLPKIQHNVLKPLDRSLRIGIVSDTELASEQSEETTSVLTSAVQRLESLGYRVEKVSLPFDEVEMMKGYYIVNAAETASMLSSFDGVDITDVEPMTWALYQYGKSLHASDLVDTLSLWDRVSVAVDNFFARYDIILSPTTNGVAPYLNQFAGYDINKLLSIQDESTAIQQQVIWDMFERSLAYTPYTQWQNITGVPAISVPFGHSRQGLPIGIQLTAKIGNEYLLLQLADSLMR